MVMSGLVFTLMALYTLIALFALFMTYLEQRQTQNTNIFLNALSFLACLFWPLTLFIVALTMMMMRRRRPATA